eukprot:555511-Lingulodinium_polyedra.AAC.1
MALSGEARAALVRLTGATAAPKTFLPIGIEVRPIPLLTRVGRVGLLTHALMDGSLATKTTRDANARV